MIPSTKKTIRFNKDGKLRVVMFSDIQDTLDFHPNTLAGYRAIIEAEKPDLVILGGDNCDGRKLKPYDEFVEYLKIISAPMEENNIPWMHIFGNHDKDMDVDCLTQTLEYEKYPNCISSHSEGIPGVSNYMVPVYAKDSDHIAYCIWAFDSNHKEHEFRPGVNTKTLLLPNTPKMFRKWDPIRFEQLMWYWNLSKEVEEKEGKLVKGMAVMHVPLHEIHNIAENPEETNAKGEWDEFLQCATLNSGAFCTMLDRGDINIIAAGHLHKDTIEGYYGGIYMCLDANIGFAVGGYDRLRGARIFDFNEDGTFESFMVHAKDYVPGMELRPDKKPSK